MVDFNKLDIREEVLRYLNSEADSSEYGAYRGWSGCPCGISRKEGNARIMSCFSNGLGVDESLWLHDQWDTEAIAREVRAIANTVLPNCRSPWRYELPILRAVVQLKRLPINGSLSAKTISALYGLSVPRAEYVSALIWG